MVANSMWPFGVHRRMRVSALMMTRIRLPPLWSSFHVDGSLPYIFCSAFCQFGPRKASCTSPARASVLATSHFAKVPACTNR
ncbi:hypothetical protein D3C73_1530470 [compost metagenome]